MVSSALIRASVTLARKSLHARIIDAGVVFHRDVICTEECRINVCRIGAFPFSVLLGSAAAKSFPQIVHRQLHASLLGVAENAMGDATPGPGLAGP
jgi:hypothetical protein